MTTYLLTWNPNRWNWPQKELERLSRRTSQSKKVRDGWSTGNNKNLSKCDRIFLLRQQKEPMGIMASGTVTSRVYEQSHWDKTKRSKSKKSNHVDIDFDTVLDPHDWPLLATDSLKRLPVRKQLWSTRSGGVEIFSDEAKTIEAAWKKHLKGIQFRANKLGASNAFSTLPIKIKKLREGGTTEVTLDVYERNAKVRKYCIDHWGPACAVCEMTFEADYGESGTRFIHAHHLNPMSKAKQKRSVDPINDLRPVCPNCHSVLHKINPPLKISDLRALRRGRLLRK